METYIWNTLNDVRLMRVGVLCIVCCVLCCVNSSHIFYLETLYLEQVEQWAADALLCYVLCCSVLCVVCCVMLCVVLCRV